MRFGRKTHRFWFLPVFFALIIPTIVLSVRFGNLDPNQNSAAEIEASQSKLYPSWMDEVIEPPGYAPPRLVYTFTCEFPTRRPDVFTTACADFGEIVGQIKWEEWSLTNSVGSGIYSVNDCDPNCSEGKRHQIPVRVWLEDVTTDGKNYFLNTLKIVPIDQIEGKAISAMNSNFNLFADVAIDGVVYQGAVWDVSRDWKEFPEMRVELP